MDLHIDLNTSTKIPTKQNQFIIQTSGKGLAPEKGVRLVFFYMVLSGKDVILKVDIF